MKEASKQMRSRSGASWLRNRKRERFLEIADRLKQSTDRAEVKAIKRRLARLTFG